MSCHIIQTIIQLHILTFSCCVAYSYHPTLSNYDNPNFSLLQNLDNIQIVKKKKLMTKLGVYFAESDLSWLRSLSLHNKISFFVLKSSVIQQLHRFLFVFQIWATLAMSHHCTTHCFFMMSFKFIWKEESWLDAAELHFSLSLCFQGRSRRTTRRALLPSSTSAKEAWK